MKRIFIFSFIVFALAVTASAQSKVSVQAAMKKFPGVSKAHMEQMIAAKQVMQIALPTWVPAGFKVEGVKSRLGRGVAIEDREFVIIYSRTLPSGKLQRFALEAGFDGLGDLMYEGTKTLSTPVGKIYLLYEPRDPEDNKKIRNYVMTEWFQVGRQDWHYIGMYGYDESAGDLAMISLADTERILRSLRKL